MNGLLRDKTKRNFNLLFGPNKIESRLIARCGRCTYQGPRGEFFIPKPLETPAFEDKCPHCRSIEVEVMDPKFAGVR